MWVRDPCVNIVNLCALTCLRQMNEAGEHRTLLSGPEAIMPLNMRTAMMELA